jgi:hypothetical protein
MLDFRRIDAAQSGLTIADKAQLDTIAVQGIAILGQERMTRHHLDRRRKQVRLHK